MPLTLEDLRPNPGANKDRKRVGRGHGSGYGKTAGRGTKGQKARSGGNIRPGFEGGQLPIQQALPYKRGFTNVWRTPWEVINVGQLQEFAGQGPVTPQVLYERGLTRGLEFPVKILGDGTLSQAVEVRAHAFSKSAIAQIEAAGGSYQTLDRTDRWIIARPRSRQVSLNSELKAARVGKVGGPSRKEAVQGAEEA